MPSEIVARPVVHLSCANNPVSWLTCVLTVLRRHVLGEVRWHPVSLHVSWKLVRDTGASQITEYVTP